MKLLFVTQALDLDEPVLSTYHNWVAALAPRYERINTICLKKGRHDLPENVRVHSLGKEKGAQLPLFYALRFFWLSWRLRSEYDAVFVHMNQEYILISGLLWKLLGKRVYLWRNHYAGSWLTDIAALFCTKVFCTSLYSYTARFKKTVLMPVGIDTDRFVPAVIKPLPHSILFFARMAPSKRPDLLVEALSVIARQGIKYTASFVGSPLPEDEGFYASLKECVVDAGLDSSVVFLPGVPNAEAPRIFQEHAIFVNCSPSGMFDKMLFEAAASGCIVLASSIDFAKTAGAQFTFKDGDAISLAEKLSVLFAMGPNETDHAREHMRALAEAQDMRGLVQSIATHLGQEGRQV